MLEQRTKVCMLTQCLVTVILAVVALLTHGSAYSAIARIPIAWKANWYDAETQPYATPYPTAIEACASVVAWRQRTSPEVGWGNPISPMKAHVKRIAGGTSAA